MLHLYPEIEPYNLGYLKVSDLHNIYFEESGNKKGIPIVFLHGGPGGCTQPKHRRYFNPDKYRIILFDQRGCGKSKPFGEIKENTTQHLIEDMERLRNYLDITSWYVYGRSWGSTLALAYSIQHPDKVKKIIIGGVFTFSEEEIEWMYKGVRNIFPDYWGELTKDFTKKEKEDVSSEINKRIMSKNIKTQEEAVWRFSCFNEKIMSMRAKKTKKPQNLQKLIKEHKIYFHYEKNMGFLKKGWILNNLQNINKIPMYIIHGRYDMCTPLSVAWNIHQKLKKSTLVIPFGGHRTSDIGILKAIIDCTDNA